MAQLRSEELRCQFQESTLGKPLGFSRDGSCPHGRATSTVFTVKSLIGKELSFRNGFEVTAVLRLVGRCARRRETAFAGARRIPLSY